MKKKKIITDLGPILISRIRTFFTAGGRIFLTVDRVEVTEPITPQELSRLIEEETR